MSELHITAKKRESVGKGHARRLRRLGDIPCTLYGADDKSVSLSVSRHEFEKLLSETRSVFVVDIDGAEQRAVVKDIQYHPVKGLMIHVDFMRVKAGQEINVSVPIKFTGTSQGETLGGVFQEIRSELDITCLPKNMPDNLEIEISHLEVGDAIRVSDLNFENITINAEENALICTVVVPRKIEEEIPVEGEEEDIEEDEEGAEPEVITAKKKEDGEETEDGEKG